MRKTIQLERDYDHKVYLIPTIMDRQEDCDRVNRLIEKNTFEDKYGYWNGNGLELGQFHCSHEWDCCGCMISRNAVAQMIAGYVYIVITESFNY